MSGKSTKLRPKVPCYCKKCDGKFVDTRTRKKHEEEENRFQAYISKKGKDIEKIEEIEDVHASDRDSVVDSSQIHDDDIVMDDPDRSDEEFLSPKPVGIRKKRRRYDRFQKTYERTYHDPSGRRRN